MTPAEEARMPKEEADLSWGYIARKAERYLEVGPDVYRVADALHLPVDSWTAAELSELAMACQQTVDGLGRTAEQPLAISVGGLYRLMELVHFARGKGTLRVARTVTTPGEHKGRILDEGTFRHRVSGDVVRVFNLVPDKCAA
jgi:hypothetical protein